MKPTILTDAALRAHFFRTREKTYPLSAGCILTPAARDFAKEQGITFVAQSMSRAPIPVRGGKPVYIIAETGEETTEKGELLTHLHDNVLVPKTHPRIAFRGQLDRLQAQIILLQTLTDCPTLKARLGELLSCTRAILGAEVKGEPLPPFTLFGMDSASLRRASHHVEEVFGIPHPIPDHTMGEVPARLNLLRTSVRETELAALRAFPKGERTDIVEALNRLSSAVYILFCQTVSQKGGTKF